MEQASVFLQITASTAIALAGFSGVVVALTGKSTESFDQQERLNLLVLLRVSAIALFFSLVPFILNKALGSDATWKISILMYGVIHLMDIAYFTSKQRKLESRRAIQIYSLIVGALIAIYQIAIGIFGNNLVIEVSYFCVLIWHLAIAGMGFANLLFEVQKSN